MVTPSVHLIISGRVQGVGYRHWVVAQARKRGLSGWVRNCADGTVEALLSGETKCVQAMIEACRKGPLAARVTDIDLSPSTERHDGPFERR